MLVLTRKSEEFIQIGNDIRLVVVSVQGNRVRLGIQAPDEVSITRISAAPDLSPPARSTDSQTAVLCPAA